MSFRFEGFIESVENVTTGEHVHKGQPLMRVYSPSLSSAAAEYLCRPEWFIERTGPEGQRGGGWRIWVCREKPLPTLNVRAKSHFLLHGPHRRMATSWNARR